MGGYGSGNSGWRPHIESALAFDLATFKKYRPELAEIQMAGLWQWSSNSEAFASLNYQWRTGEWDGELVFTGKRNQEPFESRIRLEALPLNYGGKRWWMHCPYSHRRGRKLYLFDGLDNFIHREAVHPKPTYASQRTSGTDRLINQRWAIRKKIGDDVSDLFDQLYKPKGMHWRTFEKYKRRDEELAELEF